MGLNVAILEQAADELRAQRDQIDTQLAALLTLIDSVNRTSPRVEKWGG